MKPLLDELDSKRAQLDTAKSQLASILGENPCSRASSHLHKLSLDVEHKLGNLVSTLDQLDARIDYLKLLGNIAGELDRIGHEIRMLSSASERRFRRRPNDEVGSTRTDGGGGGEFSSSLQVTVDEHKTVLDSLKAFEHECDGIRDEIQRASQRAASCQVVPVYMNDKLGGVSEMIRHALSRELDRRSTLLELKQLDDQRLMKRKSLNRNMEILHTILTSNLKNGLMSFNIV